MFSIKNQPTVNGLFLPADWWRSTYMGLHRHHLVRSCYYKHPSDWLYLCNTIQWDCLKWHHPWRQCLGAQFCKHLKSWYFIFKKLTVRNATCYLFFCLFDCLAVMWQLTQQPALLSSMCVYDPRARIPAHPPSMKSPSPDPLECPVVADIPE